MENLVPFYIDINWSIKKKKQKTRKEKIIPQKIKAESSRVDQVFFPLFDRLCLSGGLIIRSQISDQLEK